MNRKQAARLRRILAAARDEIIEHQFIPVKFCGGLSDAERASLEGLRHQLEAWIIRLRPRAS